MKTIFILADTVCRRFLNLYGCNWTRTPNIDRLARDSAVFDNHWCGSAPCVPARRDIFTGRLNFLERNWGGAEPFDQLFPQILREQKGVYSHLVTDHTFYWAPGGENYHAAFDSWEVIRGQEHDPLVSMAWHVEVPPHHGWLSEQYYKNRCTFHREEDYPSPKTYQKACDWLNLNKDADNFFLWVEGFDPHEPFDAPKEYLDLYGDTYDGPEYFWPAYAPCEDTPEQLEHIRKCYAATLTMTDKYIGKLLDILDENHMWEDTMVIFTTDHGFMLGEHGFMGKNYMPAYNEVFHLPLVIYHPKFRGHRRISALTQNVDLFPTVLDLFGISPDVCRNPLHGKSLLPLLDGSVDKLRDSVLYGYFGLSVNMTDGEHTYFRAARSEDNQPLNLYTAMPVTLRQYFGIGNMETFDGIQTGRFLPWTGYPVFKIPAKDVDYKNESQGFRVRSKYNAENLLFDIQKDYGQTSPVHDRETEEKYIRLLRDTLKTVDCPPEQFERLGI